VHPSSLPAAAAAEVEGRAGAARVSLLRAGWDVFVINPDGKLKDVWQQRRTKRKLEAAVSSS
jgi:peroxiredoxin